MAKIVSCDQEILDIAKLLREPGIAFDFGCREDKSQNFVEIAKIKFPSKPYYLVRDWVLWDVQTDELELENFEVKMTNDVVVHAKFLIEDSFGSNCYGHYRISTPLVEMIAPCFFVTRNSVYILTGSGSRKAANAKDVDAFYL